MYFYISERCCSRGWFAVSVSRKRNEIFERSLSFATRKALLNIILNATTFRETKLDEPEVVTS
jgi:hypothetical protein